MSKYYIFKYATPLIVLLFFFNQDILGVIKEIRKNIISENEIVYKQAGKIIDMNTKIDDTISVLGNHCNLFLYTQRNSATKYIYQLPIASYSSEIKNEYLSDILYKKPRVLVMPLGSRYNSIIESKIYSLILSMIDDEYFAIFDSELFIVYKRK